MGGVSPVRGFNTLFRKLYNRVWVRNLVQQVGGLIVGNFLRLVETTNFRHIAIIKFFRVSTETFSVRDRLAVFIQRLVTLGETFNITHTVRQVVGYFRQLTDTFSFTEIIVTLVNTLNLPVVRETLAFLETITTRILTYLTRNLVEGLSFLDLVVTRVQAFLTRAISETVSFVENVVTQVTQWLTRTLQTPISFVETVRVTVLGIVRRNLQEIFSFVEAVVTTVTGATTAPFDYYYVYNQNNQQISGVNLSVWWDNDTSTSYTLFYTPFAPSNPRRVILGFNTGRYIDVLSVYVSSYTAGKKLEIIAYDSWGNFESNIINITAVGWYQIYFFYSNIIDIKDIEIKTDSSVVGQVTIAEVNYFTI